MVVVVEEVVVATASPAASVRSCTRRALTHLGQGPKPGLGGAWVLLQLAVPLGPEVARGPPFGKVGMEEDEEDEEGEGGEIGEHKDGGVLLAHVAVEVVHTRGPG